ncbi:hypothetical protein GGI12_004501 [Dipsacomyces acuminosporus]|nr:hypothetical protein GGI12_004501 [Dipsacomyces acuminosporus]
MCNLHHLDFKLDASDRNKASKVGQGRRKKTRQQLIPISNRLENLAIEEFISTVESQAIPLSHLDALIQYANVQFVFVYENKGVSSHFMPFDVLKRSFYRALQHYPILVSHIREPARGIFEAVVDKGNLNMPEYRESTSDLHYAELKAASFSWNKWPEDIEISPVRRADATGDIKNAKVHITRLKDDSGLVISLSLSHCLVDGVGYFTFFNLWADTCKEMRNGGDSPPRIATQLVFDRHILKESLPAMRSPLDPYMGWYLTHSTDAAKDAASLSFAARLSIVTDKCKGFSDESHVFHISRESLDSLHASMRGFVPSGVRISDNDVLTALLYKTVAQSDAALATQKGYKTVHSKLVAEDANLPKALSSGMEGDQVIAGMACDFRHRLGIEDMNYVGNSVISLFWRYSRGELVAPTTPKSLASTAVCIRQLVNTIDGAYIGSLMDSMASNPLVHTQSFGSPIKYTSFVTNHTRLKMYDADFGDGIHQWASFAPNVKFGVAIILPCPRGVAGVNVFINAHPSIINNIQMNEYWAKVAEVVY